MAVGRGSIVSESCGAFWALDAICNLETGVQLSSYDLDAIDD
jgi:hypothetical protein